MLIHIHQADSFLLDIHKLPNMETRRRVFALAKGETLGGSEMWRLLKAYMLGVMDGKRTERAKKRRQEQGKRKGVDGCGVVTVRTRNSHSL